MSNIKGTGWLSCVEYMEKTFGAGSVEKVKQAMSREDQAVLAKKILHISWMDYGLYLRFLFAADKLLGKGDFQVILDANVYGAQKDMQGIYKLFISFISPETILKNAGQLWKQYYDAGEMHADIISSKEARLTLTNFPGIPLASRI
jgi:hypothetical protein